MGTCNICAVKAVDLAHERENELVLDKDEYFVVGDNWNSSTDSRYVEIGPISKKDIIGKVWFVISPISDFGFVN